MIDQTNVRIDEMEQEIRDRNQRRNAFYRMLHSTDRVLWMLEELNRDGVAQIPGVAQPKIQLELSELPDRAKRRFRETPAVQDALDSIFEVQEELFRWRNPEWTYDEEEGLDQAS